MQKLILFSFLLMTSGVSLFGQCETSNCNPTITGMNFTEACIDAETTTTVTIGWAMQLGSGGGGCTAPAGSWAIKISLPTEREYIYESVEGEGFDWKYTDGNTTLEGITNIPTSALALPPFGGSFGTITVTVRGKVYNECGNVFSNANVRITSAPFDTSPCLNAFNNETGDDTQRSSLGINDVVAPVTLHSFDATQLSATEAQVIWETEMEYESDYFEVERSADGQIFHKIGRVKAAGSSNSLVSYSFVDHSPFLGDNLYRLKMIDVDGSYEYTNIEVVNFTSDSDFSVAYYPNPVQDVVTVSASQDLTGYTLTVKDIAGRTIMTMDCSDRLQVETGDFRPGTYAFVLSNRNGAIISREMIIKI